MIFKILILLKRKYYIPVILVFGICFCIGCNTEPGKNAQKVDRKPNIEPDYCDVTIPPNIAPMNFKVLEEADFFIVTLSSGSGKNQIKVKSSDGVVQFSEKSWKQLLKNSTGDKITVKIYSSGENKKAMKQYDPFCMYVAKEPIDPYLAYRLIHPGYYNWSNLKIMQRSIESFDEEPVVENQILDMNCINCHSFNQYDPSKFMVHIRGSKNGTYFVDNGKVTRTDPKIKTMPGSATYPSWHPGGKYVAYSSNQVRQSFYGNPDKTIEVFDLVSGLILLDVDNNKITNIVEHDTARYMETFPSWSADGKYLYFCRTLMKKNQTNMTLEEIKATRYDIVRMPFDAVSATFGKSEMVFNAAEKGKSTSFPQVSPDGKYLIFTLHDFGTFPINHNEADLYQIDLVSGEVKKMDLNSEYTESYHAWSSNGKWVLFSSKRIDGRSAAPFFAYFGSWDHTGKPFVLPQKDPAFYETMLKSFNKPEFIKGRIKVTPRDFEAASELEAVKATPGNPSDSIPGWKKQDVNGKQNQSGMPIHE